eukprot:COSAG05_NODE_2429_length_3073_cov_8.454270_2_plen_95_part_00
MGKYATVIFEASSCLRCWGHVCRRNSHATVSCVQVPSNDVEDSSGQGWDEAWDQSADTWGDEWDADSGRTRPPGAMSNDNWSASGSDADDWGKF